MGVLPSQMVQVELFGRLFFCLEQMPDCMPAYQMTDFFGSVLHVVAGPLNRLRHSDHVDAIGTAEIQLWLEMPHYDEIVQTVHFPVCPKDL